MRIANKSIGLGEVAAVGTWSIVFGIVLYWLPNSTPEIKSNSWLIVTLFIAYIVCFISIIRDDLLPPGIIYKYAAIVLQLLCAFGLMLLIPIDFLPILTIIWVSILPHMTSLKRSMLIMFAVVTLWFVLYSIRWENKNVIFYGLLYSTFHFFAVFMNFETVKAEKASLEAQRLNKELQATQHLLSEASRQNERTRIARDLHDLLGHHLTALIINLQVASHLSQGQARDKVEQCHSLAKLLLSDVREAVSTLRENQHLDFEKMLALMIEKVPKLNIHCQIEAGFSLEQIELAKALLSCIQEAITNSLRHSGASELWITLKTYDDELFLELYDNGQLNKKFTPGNGLSGMQERVAEFNGQMTTSRVQSALKIDIGIPLGQDENFKA
ncbi:MAG: histidine kinase [Kangiellaceae bacterium]|nr:histidine kinase [Kangiellaceae bacterium]MCW8997283.1 histidine kinase [Kangiellaceae bacterium]MCW9016920.1 histidine kinase [Kangiellaceae bacterium]